MQWPARAPPMGSGGSGYLRAAETGQVAVRPVSVQASGVPIAPDAYLLTKIPANAWSGEVGELSPICVAAYIPPTAQSGERAMVVALLFTLKRGDPPSTLSSTI